MKTVLVTGSEGFVGRHMTQLLEARNWEVEGCDLEMGNPLFGLFHSDRRYDLIIHAAARGPNRQAIDTDHGAFPYNVMLDSGLFEWAIRTRQPRVVYLSSCAVYPAWLMSGGYEVDNPARRIDESSIEPIEEPFDSYGLTKLIGERMTKRYVEAGGIAHVVRPFSGYGTDQSPAFPFRAFVERAKRREDPFKIWGHAGQVRDWVHIYDICIAIMAIVDADYREPVNICTGVGTTMLRLAQLCMTDARYVGAIDVDEAAPMGAFYRVGDPTKLNEIYVPQITIEEGVKLAFQL